MSTHRWEHLFLVISVIVGLGGAMSPSPLFYPLLFVSMVSAVAALAMNLTRDRRQRRALRRS